MKATTTLPPARADDFEMCLRASTVDTLQRGGTVFDLTALYKSRWTCVTKAQPRHRDQLIVAHAM